MARKGIVTLGINDGHNAGAALIRDGEVIAAIQEERLVNEKNYSGVPHRAVREVFRISGLHASDVAIVALVSLVRVYAPLKEEPLRVRVFETISPLLHGHTWSRFYVRVLSRMRKMRELNALLRDVGLADTELTFVEHHTMHAASAYYSSPWKDEPVLVLTNDGAGDGLSATVSIGERNQLRRIAASTYYDSLGNVLYSQVTGHLGLKRWEHEYKVMGMAPYGEASRAINRVRKVIRIHPRRPLEFQNTAGAVGRPLARKLHRLFREIRFDDLAAATQRHFEDLVTQWVRNCVAETGIRKIACGGGLFLNVKGNRVLRELPEVEDVFFYPACDDGGSPVGAALEAYFRYCERDGSPARRVPLRDLYYGNDFSEDEIASTLAAGGWRANATRYDSVEDEVAMLLARGNIVARFSGRCEWGPRALGNRSILADARDLSVIRRINFAIKHRDFWMPFAASLLDRRREDYLVGAAPCPYMIEAFDTTPSAHKDLAAGLHPFDLTCRPQTVDAWNPEYERILSLFEKETGVGGLLNTSFNLHGFPMVGTPEVALQTFAQSGLDALALGNWIVKRGT